ncbi:hydroxyethylthiazole kinase [Vallitalea longa]|uniref:Hydroxyethylthiazole kinase n=1 Tax=Vallitalea longa TaxID=2936439 RepID=A0A9W5Y996_9FIRM|nr:hydroxyethylthiazole kinase [Vallitalea longa]GKX28904.1 hydroxyethylthiazole kinase [Vallitalea longa]
MDNCIDKFDFTKIYNSSTKPLIHYITNYVTSNDVANMTLAFGGSPIMAESIEEIDEITAVSSCLVINIGTVTTDKLESIKRALQVANQKHIPVILDPVGVAATSYRNKIVFDILKNYRIDVVKGNASEIKALLGLKTNSKGVDSEELDSEDISDIGVEVSRKYNTTVAITGKIDTICNDKYIAKIEGGSSMLTSITGTGCMISPLIAVCLARTGNAFTSSIYGILVMNEAASLVEKSLKPEESVGTFKVKLFDNVYNIKNKNLIDGKKVVINEIRE